MTKVIKEEFEKLGLREIDEDLFTYDTQPGMIFYEFKRLSGINDNLFTYKIDIPKPTQCVKETSNLMYNDLGEYEWSMSYEECEKIYAEVVILINKILKRGDDEVKLTDEEPSEPNDENLIDENEVAKIFRIETNVFDFETPCAGPSRNLLIFSKLIQMS
ncbi:hypothetical protein Tco_1436846 [Tanacetum coccineum]